jgi:hypothetical protein
MEAIEFDLECLIVNKLDVSSSTTEVKNSAPCVAPSYACNLGGAKGTAD